MASELVLSSTFRKTISSPFQAHCELNIAPSPTTLPIAVMFYLTSPTSTNYSHPTLPLMDGVELSVSSSPALTSTSRISFVVISLRPNCHLTTGIYGLRTAAVRASRILHRIKTMFSLFSMDLSGTTQRVIWRSPKPQVPTTSAFVAPTKMQALLFYTAGGSKGWDKHINSGVRNKYKLFKIHEL